MTKEPFIISLQWIQCHSFFSLPQYSYSSSPRVDKIKCSVSPPVIVFLTLAFGVPLSDESSASQSFARPPGSFRCLLRTMDYYPRSAHGTDHQDYTIDCLVPCQTSL